MPRAALEDDLHAEFLREFDSVEEALAELRRLEVMNIDELAGEIGPTPCMGQLRALRTGGLRRRQSGRPFETHHQEAVGSALWLTSVVVRGN